MVNPITTAKIFSTLGNNSSLIPLGVKDISNTLGMTAGSYISGGNVEGKDRFIDEMGAQFIWLLGIPIFKKVIDKTVYKLAKINPNIDTRILDNKEVFEKAKKHAPEALKSGFERIEKHQKLFKGLALGKFAAATALTMASYAALTTFRHKHTEKAIIKEIKKEESLKKANEEFIKGKAPLSFSAFEKKHSKNPSFGMNLSGLKQFMFDPVKNTMIIDGGITTERLSESRNPQDFMGYVVKEGGFWAFMYFAGPAIQKHLEKKAAKNNKPIDLDINVLQNKEFQKAIGDKSIEKHLKAFSTAGSDAQIYESLFDNSDNLVVKMAKQSGLIQTIKEKDAQGKEISKDLQKIDTQQFIDIEQIKGIKGKIEKITKEFTSQSEHGIDDFFKGVLKLKKASILKNIGYSVGALGLLVPAIMVTMRFMDKDNKEFMVKKQIYEKMKKENKFA